MKKVIMIAVLSLFFISLTENLSPINFIVSINISIFVIFINPDIGQINRYINQKTILNWMIFILTLFYEVVKANIQVAQIALSPHMNLEPQLLIYSSKLKDDLLLAILANVITLTPGTMTINISYNKLKIHCLNPAYARSLNNMSLEKILYKIEGECLG